MAYNDEAVRAKLSTLNETQESIVTVAQWIMFHRRHAERTAGLWLDRLRDSNSNKRLNLIYLANEVVQQSKARKRDDFLLAFSPLIPEATAIAYRGAHGDIRNKVKRVVEVWRQRNIFDSAIQDAAEARIAELEKTQASGAKKLLGGSLFSGSSSPGPSAPEELKPLVPLQENLNKAASGTDASATKANDEYNKTLESVTSLSAPMQVARYSGLFKLLASAENAVAESVKARRDLLVELEKLVSSNKAKLETEEEQLGELGGRKTEIESKKRQVEDAIMRGLASVPEDGKDGEDAGANGDTPGQNGSAAVRSESPQRPATEELTPPPVENITPVESPEFQPADVEEGEDVPNASLENEANVYIDDKWNVPEAGADLPEAGADLLASLSRPFSSTDMAGEESATKRQRIDIVHDGKDGQDDDGGFPGLGADDDELAD